MADQVLYRKYRPRNFAEVLGQTHITTVLENALAKGKLSHAYLFFGTRGTGKTSVARILAQELQTAPEDIYEIDAASNRGIDDIRELRDGVLVLPFRSNYKVYIIDEVHMLTREAFNALLKTLEEPPAHAIFILATTEIEKVPETIVSRCQVFTFRKPTEETLKKYILDIAAREKIKISEEAADLIALLGEGSFRDACGILQKVIPFGKNKIINREEIETVTGAPKDELVNDFLSALTEKYFEKGMAVINTINEQNIDVKVFIKLLLHKLRVALVIRFAPEAVNYFKAHISNSDFEFLKKLMTEKKATINSKSLEILLEAFQNLNYASIPTLPLELALVKITKGE